MSLVYSYPFNRDVVRSERSMKLSNQYYGEASGSPAVSARSGHRMAYNQPRLARFGDVRDVTLGGTGSKQDVDLISVRAG